MRKVETVEELEKERQEINRRLKEAKEKEARANLKGFKEAGMNAIGKFYKTNENEYRWIEKEGNNGAFYVECYEHTHYLSRYSFNPEEFGKVLKIDPNIKEVSREEFMEALEKAKAFLYGDLEGSK